MITSINWLKDIINYTSSPKELEDGLTALGLECTYKETNCSYSKIIIGEILSVDKVKASDHLNLCVVNVGDKTEEIVCGANNVKPGILVPIALPGATLNDGFIVPIEGGGCLYHMRWCRRTDADHSWPRWGGTSISQRLSTSRRPCGQRMWTQRKSFPVSLSWMDLRWCRSLGRSARQAKFQRDGSCRT